VWRSPTNKLGFGSSKYSAPKRAGYYEGLRKERAAVCSALMATQMLGLAFTQYVLRLQPVVHLPEHVVVECVGATLQYYLFEDAHRSSKQRN
jgi:hypothetical protein